MYRVYSLENGIYRSIMYNIDTLSKALNLQQFIEYECGRSAVVCRGYMDQRKA